MPTGNLSSC